MKKAPALPQKETPDGESGAPKNLTTNSTMQSVAMGSQVNVKPIVFDPPISIVTSATHTQTTPTTLRTVLEAIRDGRWKDEVQGVRTAAADGDKKRAGELKKKLPAALFSGTFTVRSTAGLAKHSGLICADLDSLGADLNRVRNRIEADPHTLAVFLSPSGMGLKVLLRCNPLRHHHESFSAARRHFRERFGLKIDDACSDVSRLCFVSFDADLFARDDAPPIPYSAEDTGRAVGVGCNGTGASTGDEGIADLSNLAPQPAPSFTIAELDELLRCLNPDCSRADWVRTGAGLKHQFGETAYEHYDAWSAKGTKYKGRSETRTVWDSLKREAEEGPSATIRTVIGMARRDGMRDLASRLAARRYDHSNPPPKPDPRFSINGRVVCTAGNLTTIGAQAKAGKSAVIGAMIAAVTCAELSITGRDTLGITASPPRHKKLLHFDTEQSPHDAHALIQRSLRRAGGSGVPKFLDSYGLAGFSAPDLVAALELKLAEWSAIDGIFAVILDGVADLVHDVNDAMEGNGFIAKLHGLAISHDCPIISVLHENPAQDSGKMRGHLGSQLERKAESNIRLKRVGDTTVIFGEKMRGAPILEKDGPCVRWSPIDDMHMSVSNLSLTADDRLRAELEDETEDIFRPHLVTVLSRKDLITGIQGARPPIGVSGAGKRFDHMKRLGVIIKDMKTGLWMISVI